MTRPDRTIRAALAIARENARACGNGADGESIRLVCDELERRLDRGDVIEDRQRARRAAAITPLRDERGGFDAFPPPDQPGFCHYCGHIGRAGEPCPICRR